MSGGQLVVLDRLGRDAKAFTLAEGTASIGSDPSCDIRIILPGVRPHQATVTVHANRTLVRAMAGETLLNGAVVSVAALQHGDTLQLGGRALRWDYSRPPPPPAAALAPCLAVPRRGAAARAKRRSEPTHRPLKASGRDSAPASTSTSGKQVAIVQPQRRDTSEQNSELHPPGPLAGPPAPPPASARKSFPSKTPKALLPDDPTKASLWIESRKPRASSHHLVQSARNSPRNVSKLTTTRVNGRSTESPLVSRKRTSYVSTGSPKNVSTMLRASADLSRDLGSPSNVSPGPASPRGSLRGAAKSAPLRLAVLKKAHSSQTRVTKIRAPLKIDHTKQAAIMLMTGHAARPRSVGPLEPSGRASTSAHKAPGRASAPGRGHPGRASAPGRGHLGRASAPGRGHPGRASAAAHGHPGRASASARAGGRAPAPPRRRVASPRRSPLRTPPSRADTQDVTESDKLSPVGRRRSSRQTLQSPLLASPKKSALKDPTAKKSTRKTESIKFDFSNLSTLSNLESDNVNIASDVVLPDSAEDLQNNMSDEDITLHYSDNSSTKSTPPMKILHSRSSRIIEKSLGSPMQTPNFERSTFTVKSPRSMRSMRGSIIVQKALDNSDSPYSRRTTKSLSDQSYSTTITSRISETLSQRSTQNLEAYSIVDLVSVDSNESGRSIYNSVDSNSTASFGTPGTVRETRSKKSSLLGSSTPYSKNTDNPETTNQSTSKKSRISTRRSASITTPENIQNILLNSTRASRPSRNRSRINDSDVLLVDEDEMEDLSPRSSRRTSKSLLSPIVRKNISIAVSPDSPTYGTITPENVYSPQDIGTPMLSFQNLLDQSSVSQTTKPSQNSRNTRRSNVTRRTISTTFIEPKRSRLSFKSRSLNLTGRRSLRKRKTTADSLNGKDQPSETEDAVTPKSAVKLMQEAVKNKHSTAKKPQSKRSLIDNLDDSDFVKELFNSPVKRKLSQSMTEFSRKFFEDDVVIPSKPTRNTITITGQTLDISLSNNTQEFTPEMFVSPLSTPSNSPNLRSLKRLFRKNTPENDLRNVQGVKNIFCRSPRNRLSDVRVKELFAVSSTADLRRVSGVKNLFQKSPLNDLRHISGVKRTLRANTPRNNLSDVQGVEQLFREDYNENNLSDVSGVEELCDESLSRDATFDRLLGRPRLRAYTKSNSCGEVGKRKKGKSTRGAKSLHDSIGLITDNVEEWLENELKRRVQNPVHESDASKSTSGSNVARELRKLYTDTVEGNTPPAVSRTTDGDGRKKSASEIYSARKLPLKKRSLASPRRSLEPVLPLKKRALPHSTPLRPAASGLSMNASELARVSPIAADVPGTLLPLPQSPKQRAARGRKPKAIMDHAEVIVVKPSPKRTRGSVIRNSPTQVLPRATRGRKTNDTKAIINKRRSSIVIAKKPPVMSPKRRPIITRTRKILNNSNNINSPNKIVSARQKSQIKVTPKKTRARVLKETVVVHKPSPQLKLRSKRQIKEGTESIQTKKPKKTKNETIDQNNIKGVRTRKTKKPAESQQSDEIEPVKSKLRRKIVVVIEATSHENAPVKKRGRKAKDIQNVSETQTKGNQKIPDSKKTKHIALESAKTSRGKKENTVGQRKVGIVEMSPVKHVNTKTADKVIRKSKRGAKDIEDKKNTNNTKKGPEKPEKKTRASKKSVVESVQVEPKRDGRKTRKTIVKEEAKPSKPTKTAPVRALRKRPALDPVEDTAVETKKRRTRRAVAQGTS